ncbi:MAG: hypothetical protein OSJ46_05220 [Duncaniella sp.]|nr:hypothetical protein [Duncaniella sp.]HBI58139.1 hypothetical protein [Porphyromonadaceae bacterium]
MKFKLILFAIFAIKTATCGISQENSYIGNKYYDIHNMTGDYTGDWEDIYFHLKLKADSTYFYVEHLGELGTESHGKWNIENDHIIFLTDDDPLGFFREIAMLTYTDTLHPAKIVNRNCIELFNLHEELDSTFGFPKVIPLKRTNGKFFMTD